MRHALHGTVHARCTLHGIPRTARYGLHAKPCDARTHPGGARERLSLTEPPDLDSTRARHHKSSSSTGTQYRGAASARGVSTGIIDSRCIGRECVKPPCGLSNKGRISSEPPKCGVGACSVSFWPSPRRKKDRQTLRQSDRQTADAPRRRASDIGPTTTDSLNAHG